MTSNSKFTVSDSRFLMIFVAVFIAIEVVNVITGRALIPYGIMPRDLGQSFGILLAPLIHSSFHHFLSNLVPLIILGWLLLQAGRRQWFRITLTIWLITGLLVWIVGRPSYHVGASGVVYGWFGYLILAGWYSRRFRDILISLLVLFFYGGLFFGLLSFNPWMSWESHLAGFASGIACAIFWHQKKGNQSR